ncbi:hypothetical protein NKY66_28625 [Sinorhizobium meliloti]|uniref:hypothetical protein n=1 Tax=Rhizobium meliloti TaxID=382 RepID=UPI003D64B540
MSFSNFIIYVDESGDHSLTSIDENYPVLSFCIFEKAQYSAQASRDLQDFKFRERFLNDFSAVLETTPMTVIAAVQTEPSK